MNQRRLEEMKEKVLEELGPFIEDKFLDYQDIILNTASEDYSSVPLNETDNEIGLVTIAEKYKDDLIKLFDETMQLCIEELLNEDQQIRIESETGQQP